ncbi:MAG: response regulator [Luteolibacter sp.]
MALPRVLIVDDSIASRESLAVFFELEGYEVRTAQDGVEGVEAVAGFKPDVVFMDIHMPELDGHAAAEQIRASPDGDIPKLIALTGFSGEEVGNRAEQSGFDLVMCKPVSPDKLRETLAGLFPGNGGSSLS